VRILYNTPVTPNQVTYTSFVIGVVAAAFFFTGDRGNCVIGALLAFLSSELDGVDGLLARARNQTSVFGAYLDLFLDRVLDFLLFGSVVAATWKQTGNDTLLIAGLVGLALYNLQLVLYYMVEKYRDEKKTGISGEARGLMFYGLLAFTLLGWMEPLVWVLLIEPVCNIVWRLIYFHWLKAKAGAPA
jgi:CDP-L-myo-inositol myo-inositolphosphotransferase